MRYHTARPLLGWTRRSCAPLRRPSPPVRNGERRSYAGPFPTISSEYRRVDVLLPSLARLDFVWMVLQQQRIDPAGWQDLLRTGRMLR
jgi:hypothetical protein